MTKEGREGRSDQPTMAESQLSRVATIRVAEHARAPRRSEGTVPKPRLSSEGAAGEHDRRDSRRSGPTDRGFAGCEGLESSPHSQRRASMYITNTVDTAMVDPSTANKTNSIACHTPFVALRKPFAPFLCSLRRRRVHTPNNVSLELEKATSG